MRHVDHTFSFDDGKLMVKASPAQRGLHSPSSVLESCQLEGSLVIGNCLNQFGRVQVQIDVNQVGKQPLWVPAVLLGVLHLQVAALGTWNWNQLKAAVKKRFQQGTVGELFKNCVKHCS